MPFVIRAVAYAGVPEPCAFEGQYLERYDPDEPDPAEPMATFTDDPSRAKKFADHGAALEEWRRVRTVDPVRPDGKPNRPLTALTVTIEPVEGGRG